MYTNKTRLIIKEYILFFHNYFFIQLNHVSHDTFLRVNSARCVKNIEKHCISIRFQQFELLANDNSCRFQLY